LPCSFWALVQRPERLRWRTRSAEIPPIAAATALGWGCSVRAVADLAPELEGFCPEIDKFGARSLRVVHNSGRADGVTRTSS
jgi:hypothetical protein